jgi:hypothetical protein
MSEYVNAVARFADDLQEIGASTERRERGILLYMVALTDPSQAAWRSLYQFVFDVLAQQKEVATWFDSDAAARLMALIEDDFGASLFAGRHPGERFPAFSVEERSA